MRSLPALCLVFVAAVMGCGQPSSKLGGGGALFFAPNAIIAGQETTVGMSFLAPGSASSDPSKRYTNIVLQYALSDGTLTGTANARVRSVDENYMFVDFRIPQLMPRTENVSVKLSVSYLMDGNKSVTDGGTVPINKPKQRQAAPK